MRKWLWWRKRPDWTVLCPYDTMMTIMIYMWDYYTHDWIIRYCYVIIQCWKFWWPSEIAWRRVMRWGIIQIWPADWGDEEEYSRLFLLKLYVSYSIILLTLLTDDWVCLVINVVVWRWKVVCRRAIVKKYL